MGKDTTAFKLRFKAYKNGKAVSEIYDAGLPRYAGGKGDGYRYVLDDMSLQWDRITDDDMARAFADLTVTPNGNRDDNRTNPVYHDPRLKYAGYVTKSMLEDEANSKKQKETSMYAPGLELVSPEFDLLFFANPFRSNPLTLDLWRNRSLAKEINKVVDEGLVGATKDIPVVNVMDMYNPEHFRSTVKYNPLQIEAKTAAQPKTTASLPKVSLSEYVEPIGESVVSDEPLALPLNKMSEYVDSEGNVNMRNVVTAVRNFYKKHPEARNYKEVYNSSGNLYQHIKAVVKSAQEAPLPEGYTRQQLVQSALFHDIGKVLDPTKTHDKKSVEIMREMGIQTSPEVETAVGRHMSSHLGNKDPLSKALHFVDVARGEDMSSALRNYSYLGYPGMNPTKINPIYKNDIKWLLENIINPILDKYGYGFTKEELSKYGVNVPTSEDPDVDALYPIPSNVDAETARKMVLDKIKEHRTFVRSVYTSNEHDWKNLKKQAAEIYGKDPKDITNEEAFKAAVEYIKKNDTNSGTMGLDSYLDTYELNPKDFQALYTSSRDNTASGYMYGSNTRDNASHYVLMNINDDPNWSLAELWANNEFPVVYEGSHNSFTNWRNYELPFRLNTGLDLEKESVDQSVKVKGPELEKLFQQRLLDGLKEDPYVPLKYKDIKPTEELIITVPWKNNSFNKHEMDLAKSMFENYEGGDVSFYKKIDEINELLSKYNVLPIQLLAYSEIDSKNLVIKYNNQYNNLLRRLRAIEEFANNVAIYGTDVIKGYKEKDIYASRPGYDAWNNTNAVKDLYGYGLITKKQYDVMRRSGNTKYGGNLYRLVKKAKDLFFKESAQARKIDAFKRLKRLKEQNEIGELNHVGKIAGGVWNSLTDEERRILNEYRLGNQGLTLEKIKKTMQKYGVLPNYSYMSPDGYRIYSTERLSEPDATDMQGNHYVVVGPRGSKQLNVVGNWDPTVRTRSHNHGGSLISGTSRNFGALIPPILTFGLINNHYKKSLKNEKK